jgi:hypothetical protein
MKEISSIASTFIVKKIKITWRLIRYDLVDLMGLKTTQTTSKNILWLSGIQVNIFFLYKKILKR